MPNQRLQKVGESDIDYCKAAARYSRSVFNKLSNAYENRGTHDSHLAAQALKQTEARFTDLGTFGVEGDCTENGEGHFTIQYLNAGDTYALTVLYVNGQFRVGDWGYYAEKQLS